MHIAGTCAKMLDDTINPIDVMNIDRGGEGAAIFDRLVEMGYGPRVRLVNFGSSDTVVDRERYINKRGEMWGDMRDWLMDEGGAQIPDDDALQADLCAPGYTYDSEQRIKLERKEDIKKRGLRSPDIADALALTFATQVMPRSSQPINKPRRLA
jgi:hypothetical protein